jgi:uncharacterized OsmC-like protein
MIEVNLRDRNNLIVLSATGKAPIRGRVSPNQFFHSPLELLLCSLGLCIGGTIVNYCRLNNINISLFESVIMVYKMEQCCVDIKYSKILTEEHMRRISDEITNCPIAKQLKRTIGYAWYESDIPDEELLKKQDVRPCCGGK